MFGTLSSGTDMFAIVLNELVDFWETEYDVQLWQYHSFACESDAAKAAFLNSQLAEPTCIFLDNADLSGSKAPCLRHGNDGCVVPHSRMGAAGFTCKSRSSLNVNRSLHKGCVQKGSAETGVSWGHTHSFLDAHHPDSFLLENVESLGQEVPDSSETDAEFIVRELRQLGYGTVLQIVTQARRYGSKASRKRLFWLAVLSDEPGLEEIMRDIIKQAVFDDEDADHWEQLLLPRSLHSLDVTIPGDEMIGAKFDKMLYKAEHMQFYDDAKLEWPAPRLGETALTSCLHLDQRSYEVVFFLHYTYPYQPDADDRQCEFIDCNMSLKRLTPDGPRRSSPWRKNEMPSFTGSGTYIMRWAVAKCGSSSDLTPSQDMAVLFEGPSNEVKLRQVDGLELMQFIGYHMTYMRDPWPDHELCTSLAGNAFSGFNLIPLIMALTAVVKPDCKFTRRSVPKPSMAIHVADDDDSYFSP